MKQTPREFKEELLDQQYINRRSLASFGVWFVLLCIFFSSWYILANQKQSAANVQPIFRSNFERNEGIFSRFYSAGRMAKPFSKAEAVKNVRINGDVGMDIAYDTQQWVLKVARKPDDTLLVTLADIKALPKTEVVFDFKCVEGWSQVTYWGGVRFSDFLKKYNLAGPSAMSFVGMVTPDSQYYVGVDMPSMLQPQTLLCYEMNGAPLPKNQGAPLRLIIPVKYGIKHIKRIGTMFFSNAKPRDYWAEQGYDYYAGL